MKITVVGTGYVGLSNAMLFSKQHQVIALDIDEDRVNLLNERCSPIKDDLIEQYLQEATQFQATLNKQYAYNNADIVIITTPTNYNEITNYFDTSTIENVLSDLEQEKSNAVIVIKSTVPVGFVNYKKTQYPNLNIIFSPEFLREGTALYDNLHPSRIVVGEKNENGQYIGQLFKSAALKPDVPIVLMNAMEAEAVKLFSNTYLAMRVAYFNELDTYCASRELNSKDVIQAVGLDPRIGTHYNNPSFGYGGYCLPKDTKQLLTNYQNIPQNLISSIIQSNSTRKNFITQLILAKKPKVVGVYRLIMKSGSDNFRQSAILDIIKQLQNKGIEILIYEPMLCESNLSDIKVIKNLNAFKEKTDIIIANRISDELIDVIDKVFTRDLFRDN